MTIGGQVKVLNATQWQKLEKHGRSITHQTIWALLRFTACRSQEARLLIVDNVYKDPVKRIVKDEIFFPASIRKGKRRSLSVPASDKLKTYLERYQPKESGYLFPSPRNPEKPISYEGIYKYMKQAVIKAGMGHEKIATHSGRRSQVTHLHNQGVSLETIRRLTGHVSLVNLQPYVETDSGLLKRALNNSAL
ncbi:MAG: site-specific integrase [Crocosphaera sp.]|nr:site-specific integrase [Crocosphaera sp.]